MVWGSSEREIYAFPDMADSVGGVSASFHNRLHGQWCHYFPQRSLIFANTGWKFLWKKPSYAVRLLGICIDVTSSWATLEYDAGSGGKSSKRNFKGSYLHTTYCCNSGGYIRYVCFCKAGHRELYAVKGSLCVFDYDEPLFFFLLDYVAVIGLFIFVGHYFTLGLKQTKNKLK